MSVDSSASALYTGHIYYSVQEVLGHSASGAESQASSDLKGDSMEISDAARELLRGENQAQA